MNSSISRRPIYGLIMAGGGGTRFWPVSTEGKPKQFLDILGVGETMLQSAARRIARLTDSQETSLMVITSQRHLPLAKGQLTGFNSPVIIGEPSKRNTAPCIALAVAKALRESPESVMVVVPSDHLITDDIAFRDDMQQAIQFASTHDTLVTIGIKPTRPATEYGYLELGDTLNGTIRRVARFREKPDAPTAEQFLSDGNYLWNAGMFVWRVEVAAMALRKHMPGLLEAMESLPWDSVNRPETFLPALTDIYERITPQSIDYGLMEKAESVAVLPATFGWSDVGTWQSIRQLMARDEQGNSARGNVTFTHSTNCLLWASQSYSVRIENVDNVTVVLTEEGLLVRGEEGR